MAEVKFHPDLEQQKNEPDLPEKLQRLLCLVREQGRPLFRPDRPQGRRPQEQAREDFSHRQRLSESPPPTTEQVGDDDDDHPLQQNQLQMALDGGGIHK